MQLGHEGYAVNGGGERGFGESKVNAGRRVAGLLADAAGARSIDAEYWVCFPFVCCHTQGRLAEARLTLGYNTQPFQGWCVEGAEWRKKATPRLRFTIDQTLQIFGKVGKLVFIISGI
jgi:hypothetical protein